MTYTLTLVVLAFVCFAQNMAFTAVSRSRQGADPEYHRKVAWASNGVYLIAQLLFLQTANLIIFGFSAGYFLKNFGNHSFEKRRAICQNTIQVEKKQKTNYWKQ